MEIDSNELNSWINSLNIREKEDLIKAGYETIKRPWA